MGDMSLEKWDFVRETTHMKHMRKKGRLEDELRKVSLIPEVLPHSEGSAEISIGQTKLICTASVEERVPKWLAGSGQGWVTAEYGMLPRSTHQRISRQKSSEGGRAQEISRLIGRCLRSTLNLNQLGEKQICVDCDVIQADGGTRTAAITGGFVALALALRFLKNQKILSHWPLKHYIAAISVGWKKGQCFLDLDYDEDSSIDTDMNVAMNSQNQFIEIQSTSERGHGLSSHDLSPMLEMAQKGCQSLFHIQSEILKDFFPLSSPRL